MKKTFDSVKFQRKAREKLSKRYNTNRNKFLKELHNKYKETEDNNAKLISK